MDLPQVYSHVKGVIVSQIKSFNWAKRKAQSVDFLKNFIHKKSWKTPQAIGGMFIAVVLIGGISYYLVTTTSAAAVIINGQQIGLVRNVNAGQNLVETILEAKGKPFGLIAKTDDQITYKSLRVKTSAYNKSVINANDLAKQLNCYLNGYDLDINGSLVAVLPSKDAVNKVLKEYQDYYVKPDSANKVTLVNFAEKVNIKPVKVQPAQMQLPKQVFDTLLKGEAVTTDYTVQPNDSWWLIARKNNMLTDDVVAGNPGMTIDTVLQPGQVVKLVDVTPYLNVISQGTYTGTEVIPYDVQTKYDPSVGPNRSKVVTRGNDGAKLVTYSYVQQNGIDIKQDVLQENVITPPVTEVILRGPGSQSFGDAFNVSRGGGSGASGIVHTALGFLGSSYVFGGTNPSGFDCSGFTKYVFANSGISLPRTSYAQFASGTRVSIDELKPGDLLFFHTYSSGASHVGIYIGGGRFVHAANPSSGVEISNLDSSYYSSHYLGARRYW